MKSLAAAPDQCRYVVGIDLGTTNSALCFVDTASGGTTVETFRIPQVIAPGEVGALETLPSFLYRPAAGEFPSGSLRLPCEGTDSGDVVGVFAREQGKLVPGRVVESAKSWLCHPGVDRTSPLLPWQGAADVSRLSPVQVSAAYLSHLRSAWNAQHPADPLEQQEVILTLPASFDEVARNLTVAAARLAGLPRVVLIEEPQAAFYAWLDGHAAHWSELVSPGQNILVCDIGGGTSDFTLIRVREHATEQVQFHRVAVGEHLLLGGDNLDLALAHHLEQRLAPGGRLDPRQWGTLLRICRHVKETLMSSSSSATYSVTLPGSGSKMIGGGLQAEVTREEVQRLLLEGFFPRVGLQEVPHRQASGFKEFGLPYAADPAATRHLARFLDVHIRSALELGEGGSIRPDAVLFNGGVFASELVQQRVIEVLADWFRGDDADWQPQVLQNDRYDLAVARGAAYYGLVRRGAGIRIAAGLPRTYYLGVETAAPSGDTDAVQALCLMAAGAEPGAESHLETPTFHLAVATPVEFPLFHSSLRLTDRPGTITPIERESLTPLPPIRTVLRSRQEKQAAEVEVQLHSRLTEIGTLEVWCTEVSGQRSWQLQFDIRAATQTDATGHTGAGEAAGVLEQETIHLMQQVLQKCFGPAATESPAGLMKRLARTLSLSREEWPPALLREIWAQLLELEAGRRRSAEHEARWLNLFGYSLRPGYGMALDDWRVAESWKRLRGQMFHPGPAVLSEWWILWRRIAGGLAAGQQQALANPLLTRFRDEQRKQQVGKASRSSGNLQEKVEAWRALGAQERLPLEMKRDLGTLITRQLSNSGEGDVVTAALCWTLGRLGARVPLYGPLNSVVAPETARDWVHVLLQSRRATPEQLLAVMQLSRRTGDRYRDINDATRTQVLNWFSAVGASEEYVQLVRDGGELESQTSALIFGEALPIGLRVAR